MKFRVLGALQVEDAVGELVLGRGKQRALLAVLLLHAGDVVPADRLIDALWGESPPASALNSVHIYVSQLRRVLGDGRLVTRRGGYSLELAPGELDAERFEQLLADGRGLLRDDDPERAAATLREALALWRGPPLADFTYEPFAQSEIARLEELRLEALEERLDADLRLGRHRELVSELEAAVRAHPLRERLRGQLMLALYRCGRQAEALDTYQQARRMLAEELGLAPGPSLQELERAVLRQDPQLAAAEPVPAMRLAHRRGGLSLLLGGAVLLAAAAATFLLLPGDSSVVSVAPDSVAVVEAGAGEVTAGVPIGAGPSAVAVGGRALWVTSGDNSVSRVELGTRSVRQTIDVGGAPADVAVSNGVAWVANGLDGTVSRIDVESSRVVDTIAVGNGPTGVAADAGGVWVTNSADGTVARIDSDSGRLTRTLPAAVGAAGIAVGFGRLWVLSPPSHSVAVLDPRSGQVIQRIGVGADPEAVAIGSGAVWVANRADGTVSKIDPRAGAVTDTVHVGGAPVGVAAGDGRIWVANAADRSLQRVDPSTGAVVATVHLGNPPQDIALWRRTAYAAVRSSGREHRGGAVRLAWTSTIKSIDPAQASCWCAAILTNDGLVGFRRVGGVQGTQLVPNLAVSLPTVTDGGSTYTFRVRRGVRYSNGAYVQPTDFRRGIERVYEVYGPRRSEERVPYYDGIVGARRCAKAPTCDLSRGIVVDPRASTVTFHLTAPDPDFLFKLALPFASAVPVQAPAHDVGTHPLPATGPYRIAEFQPRTHTLRLVRNARFREWAPDAQPDGYPDAISWSWYATAADVIRAVENGSADIAVDLDYTLPKPDFDRVATRHPARLHMSPRPHTGYFFLNTRIPPFDDRRLRRAVNDAFDRAAFARIVGPAFAPTCQILPPNLPGYRRTCPYHGGGVAALDAARRRVRRSRTGGSSVTVWVPTPFAAQGRYMVSLLHAIGFRPRLTVLPLERYFAKVLDSRSRAQIGYWGWAAEFPSPIDVVQPVFGCAGFVPASPGVSRDPSEFCDRKIDARMERAAALQAEDPSAANVLWQRIERDILAQAPMVPTSNRRSVDFVAARVGHYEYHPQWGVLLDRLWVR
jgi:peptide/nickel transport system substrate-binding protein